MPEDVLKGRYIFCGVLFIGIITCCVILYRENNISLVEIFKDLRQMNEVFEFEIKNLKQKRLQMDNQSFEVKLQALVEKINKTINELN